MNIGRRQGQNAKMYAIRYPRNHLSSRFRPSDWKPPLNRPPQPQETRGALETFWRAIKKMRTAPANVCRWILANRARLSNPSDCADRAYTQTGAATKSQNDPIREQLPCERAWREATCRAASLDRPKRCPDERLGSWPRHVSAGPHFCPLHEWSNRPKVNPF